MSDYKPSDDFPILKIIIHVIFTLGMLTIGGGVVSAFGWFVWVRENFAFIFRFLGAAKYNPFTDSIAVLCSVIWAVFWFGVGVFQIAVSQLIDVFLDIRNDTRQMLLLMLNDK